MVKCENSHFSEICSKFRNFPINGIHYFLEAQIQQNSPFSHGNFLKGNYGGKSTVFTPKKGYIWPHFSFHDQLVVGCRICSILEMRPINSLYFRKMMNLEKVKKTQISKYK